MKKIFTVLLIIFVMPVSCGYDLIYDPEMFNTPTPDPSAADHTVRTGHGLFSFIRRLFGAEQTGPERITAGQVPPVIVFAGIVCALLLITAVSYFMIRKRTERHQAS